METTVDQTAADTAIKKRTQPQVWLVLAFVVGLCLFSLCLAGSGVILWQSLNGRPEVEEAAAFSLPPQDQPERLVLPPATLASPMPTLEPTEPTQAADTLPQTTQPVPTAACPQIIPVKNDTVILTPTLSSISFATRQDDTGWPLDPSLQFTTTTTQVLATFGYAGMRDGLTWERVWLFGNEELARGRGLWDAGPEGKLTVRAVLDQGGFAPGQYTLEIYLAGQLLSQDSFLIIDEDTPTQRPVEVAYTTWNEEQRQINLLNLETGQPELLVQPAHNPAWSPDAKGLLFFSDTGLAEGTPGLWVYNTSQSKSYQINEVIAYESIAWSPHRRFVASTQAEETGTRLVLWDINENRSFPGPPGADPAWSPDGLRLAYRSCDQSGWHISTMQVISSHFGLSTLQHLTVGDDSQPDWSWDGQRLAFVRQEGASQDIYSVRTDGSGLIRLTDHPGADITPAWTPDHRLIFRSLRASQWGLYIMNADGSGERQLVAADSPPGWQPDRLAVSTDILAAEPPPPQPQFQIPAGHGLLAVSNRANKDEMTFTIANVEHKIGPYQLRMLPLKPGRYTWTASWPGKASRTGTADIGLGQVAYPVVER